MPDKEHANTTSNNRVVVTHTHYKPSFSATIMAWLFMPRPPLEEGEDMSLPRLDVKTAMMILGIVIIIGLIAFCISTQNGH